ncbi:TPA: shikimate dehydrogenase [Escherichia coli]|uniref:shikimate dehydrogenase family protein n=1 Tax=Escherichia coli TaxID=562 RepID=UPI0006A1C10D|nr:shikimate dehydrogenase [Escherichia coli]MDA6579211.1 shikimate dehydrogenase [Escherichia coli]CTT64410.1 shikimate dehydrogenase [Escherichia coli]CTZ89694.1 shikimate dehydrogenase [Escherichia coli]
MKPMVINGSTRLYGIAGDPVAQVKTPELLNSFFQQTGINAVCVPLQVATSGFEASLRGVMQLSNLDGLVITVPHKVRACALTESLSAEALRVGAVNVLRRCEDGGWHGDMFDGTGLTVGLLRQGFVLKGQHVKQLGAGGSGAAVAFALLAAGAASVTLCDPDDNAAQALAQRINASYPQHPARVSDVPAELMGIDLLINCSPIGMKPDDGLPAPFADFNPSLQVVDIIMHPAETPLLAHARRAGCHAVNGKPMIEGQLAEFIHFFGLADKESLCARSR